jgi:hypothetical protein
MKRHSSMSGRVLAPILMAAGLAFAALFASAAPALAQTCDVFNCMLPGGAEWDIGPGGVLNILTGGKLELNGVDVTGATSTGAVAGVASGYKLARGETALGGSNPTAVTTGLTSILACAATIKLASAPGVGTSLVTYGSSGGTMNVYGWKVTSSSVTTLVASTGTETVGWVCVGT